MCVCQTRLVFIYSCPAGCCSIAKSCLTVCDLMDCSRPDVPVLHYLPECAQTHINCWWCHPTISSSVVPFSTCLQSFPASGSLPMSWLFASGGQSISTSASTSVLPMNIQGWFPLGFTGLISLLSNGLSRTFSSIAFRKHRFFGTQVFMVQHWHLYMTTVKTIALTRWTFVAKVMSLLFNRLSKGSHTTELN